MSTSTNHSSSQPEFRITIDGVWAASLLLNSASSAEQLEHYLGEAPRVECANQAAPEWRKVIVFDGAGIYLLQDVASSNCVSVTFVWQPETVPYPPKKSFAGRVQLNSCWLTQATSMTDIPVDGLIGLARSPGSRLTGFCPTLHVSLKYKMRSIPSEGRARLRPAYLELGYSTTDMPQEETLKRLRKN